MKHILKPDIYIKRALDLDMAGLWERGIRGVVLDVDNTLVPHNSMEVTPDASEFVRRLKAQGFRVIVLSNNREERVAPLAEELGLPYEFDCLKPKKKFYRMAMEHIKSQGALSAYLYLLEKPKRYPRTKEFVCPKERS